MTCPWCGERVETYADASEGDAEYIEDCPVCCRPITMHIATDADGELSGWRADDDR
jgi:hypothetical protein